MKVILLSFTNKVQIKAIYLLKEMGVDVLYWTGARSTFEKVRSDKETFPHTIFHDTYEATRGELPKEVDTKDFEIPVDLLKSMYDCESVALTMMNAIDFANAPLNMKKHIYYGYVTYWSNLLKKLKPDAIL